MYVIVKLVVARGCRDTSYVPRKQCEPAVKRNDAVEIAGFWTKGKIIRYNWQYLLQQTGLFAPAEADREWVKVLIGIMAHEYGHYLDAVSNGALREKWNIANPVFSGFSNVWKAESWADAVAGCILGSSAIDSDSLDKFLIGLNSTGEDDHPPGDKRLTAVRLGWQTCSDDPPPQSLFAERQNATPLTTGGSNAH
jgi:hypothetical protein